MKTPRMIHVSLVAAASFAAVLFAAGCIGYSTYPRAGGQVAPSGINSAAAEDVTVAAMVWALDRYPPPLAEDSSQAVVVAVPPSVAPRRAYRIADKLASAKGSSVLPATEAALAAGHPVYRIGRVAIRSDEAEVDVYRPAFDADAGGQDVYQLVTITLRGGIRPWRVIRTRPWALDAFDPPPLGVLTEPRPEDDRAS